MTETEAKTMAARTLEALAGPLAQELAKPDAYGRQITLHIPPGGGDVRIQLPPRIVKVGAPGAPTTDG